MMVHWYLLWSGWEFQNLTKIWPNLLTTHHWCLTCSQCVCSLWRVVRPWLWTQPSLLQQSLVQYSASYARWCTDIYSGQGENFRIWPKSGLTFVRPWSWTQQAYSNNHWWIQCHISWWCTGIYSDQGENFRIWQKSGYIFGNTSLMSGMFPRYITLVEGCQTLVMDPTSLLQTIIGGYSASLQDGALIFTLVRVSISGSDQNLA